MTWLLVSSAWMVGVTLGSAGHAAPTFGVVVARVGDLLLRSGRRLGRVAGQAAHGLARDVADRKNRWWLRVGLRTAVFHVPTVIPTLFFMGATRGSTVPGVVYTANAAPNGWTWNVPPDALLSLLLTILLFSTARRGNGWTGVHELLSRTRVVQRNVLRPVASAAPKASPADLVPALSSLRRVGPYAVHTMVGETGGGRLFVGVDPILRRHVWIHEVPPGTPPVDATRRDVSRPGRLYWLAGRRSATENWDAFEAPRGEPFLSAPPTSDWRQVHRALSSLAIELDASAHEDEGHTAQSRPRVEASGRTARAARFLVARVGRAGRQSDSQSCRAAGGRLHARIAAPATEPAAPLSATTLLNRLASGAPPALADVKAELLRLASIPSRPSRIRRALPIVMAAMPVAVPILAVTVMLPNVRAVLGRCAMPRAPDVDDVDH